MSKSYLDCPDTGTRYYVSMSILCDYSYNRVGLGNKKMYVD